MAGSLKFRVNELPDPIYEPLRSFSAFSADPNFYTELQSALDRSFNYTCKTDEILNLLDAIEQSQASFFAVSASNRDNKLEWSSRDPTSYQITLTEHSFSHNSFMGRHLPFKKAIPPKGSSKVDTRYHATVKRSEERYSKDVNAAVAALFENSSVSILTDIALELGPMTKELQRKVGQITTTEFSHFTDVSPLTMSTISDEDQEEFSEYLGLLHLNSYPNLDDSHVSATTSYSHGLPAGDREVPLKLSLRSVSSPSPLLLSHLLKSPTCLSIQATTENRSFLSYYSGTALYTWEMVNQTTL